MVRSYDKGCGIAVLLVALFVAALFLFFWTGISDASSHQSIDECLARMSGPILEKTAALPGNAVLRAKNARIEHHLYGNEKQARALARSFDGEGWQTSVGPVDEFGWDATLIEDPVRFKANAAQRIRQLCSVAARNNMLYREWWINAPKIADYVAQ